MFKLIYRRPRPTLNRSTSVVSKQVFIERMKPLVKDVGSSPISNSFVASFDRTSLKGEIH